MLTRRQFIGAAVGAAAAAGAAGSGVGMSAEAQNLKLTGYELDIVLSKAAPKKKKQNVEDFLLSAIEEASEE